MDFKQAYGIVGGALFLLKDAKTFTLFKALNQLYRKPLPACITIADK